MDYFNDNGIMRMMKNQAELEKQECMPEDAEGRAFFDGYNQALEELAVLFDVSREIIIERPTFH